MKLLKIVANNFKLCSKNFEISFVPIANKTEDDKEFELHEITDNLYTYTTMGIIGKNASGKTTVAKLLNLVYEILSSFRVSNNSNLFLSEDKDINLDITFYHENKLYRYLTDLGLDSSFSKTVVFKNEKIYSRNYSKTMTRKIFNYEEYTEINIEKKIPDDTSILYTIFDTINIRGLYFSSDDFSNRFYSDSFHIYKKLDNGHKIIETILKMFDEHLDYIEMINEDKYIVYYTNKSKIEVNSSKLNNILSSGTIKAIKLLIIVTYSLKYGIDLVIDDIECHFHKIIVEYVINLYKDKMINKKYATLIFTTHYWELLDLFNRTDNIYITHYKEEIIIESVYKKYRIRKEKMDSRIFNSDLLGTKVDYEALMNFKKNIFNS